MTRRAGTKWTRLVPLLLALAAACQPESYRGRPGTATVSSELGLLARVPAAGHRRQVIIASRFARPARRPLSPAAGPVLDQTGSASFQQGLQPDASYQHAATTAWAYWPDDNYGSDEYLALGANGNVAWFFLHFDLQGHLPDGAEVQQATLSLYAYDAYGYKQSAGVRPVLEAWEEDTLTYNNQPNLDAVTSEVFIEDFGQWWDWDVTALAANWQADPAANHGLAIFPTNDTLYDGDWILWCADDFSTLSLRPRLTVDYLLPEHRAAFVSWQAPPATMYLGERRQVQLVFENQGTDTWQAAAGYALTSLAPPGNTTWGTGRVELPAPVARGQQVVLAFEVVAPDSTGDYTFQWSMSQDGFGPFGESSPAQTVTVTTRAEGLPCNEDGQCTSGFCRDGYCCESDCSSPCRRCDLAGSEGQCSPRAAGTRCSPCASCDASGQCNQFDPAGSDPADACPACWACPGDGADCVPVAADGDPLDDCAESPPESCSTTGLCDGTGNCRLWPAGTACGPESCSAGVHQPAPSCDGAGACQAAAPVPCTPYVCEDAFRCRSDCLDDGHCVGGSQCQNNRCISYLQLGESCQSDEQCISGFCTDGVCCQERCSSPCHFCAGAGSAGSCLPVADGEDPRDECPGQGTCGGVCDAAGACRFPAAGLHCAPCLECDGQGFCSQPVAADSDPYDDCPACLVCSGDESGCRVVPAGADPLDDCPDQPPESCGFQGVCNGSGGCPLWPAGTECLAASCQDGLLQLAHTCDGNGSCLEGGNSDCGGLACADEHSCRDSCSEDGHCLPGHYCQQGQCPAQLEPGTPCQRPGQCASGFCVDGVCCRTECSGLCRRCDLAGAAGDCPPVGDGQDPDRECGGQGFCAGVCDGQGGCRLPGPEVACGPCARCDGSGGCTVLVPAGSDPEDSCGLCRVCAGDRDECIPVAAGADPEGECDEQPAASCGHDGSCDGRGGCRLWPAQTICGAASCQDSATLIQFPVCDGSGNCLPGGTVACSPGECQDGGCTEPEGTARISIEDSPGGPGRPVGDMTLSADDSLQLYAVARDQDGVYLGDVVVGWELEGGIGTVTPGPDRRAEFAPTTVGSGRVLARAGSAALEPGSTGIITVTPGLPAGDIPLRVEPPLLPADGVATAQVWAGPIHDSDGNLVADGSAFEVLLQAGELLGDDADPGRPGFQRLSTGGGFVIAVRAPDQPARAELRVQAVPPGRARGETVLLFGDERPVARAGPDRQVWAGAWVVLDGSASFDPQGRPLEYLWAQQQGPPVQLLGADSARAEFAAPLLSGDTQLEFSLVVAAAGRQSEPDSVTITVAGGDGQGPQAVLDIEPGEGPAPLVVRFDASASQAVEPAALEFYRFDFGDDESRQGQLSQVEHTYTAAGGYGVLLTVVDSQGRAASASGQVQVEDGQGNRPPQVSLTAHPPRGAAPLAVLLRAEAGDGTGQVTGWEWDLGNGYFPGPQELRHTFARPGRILVRVRATDDGGLTSTALAVVEVTGAEGLMPPQILSQPPLAARVGEAYEYRPQAAGSAPFAWSLGKNVAGETVGAPAGMSITATSGELTWTPQSAQAGEQTVVLVVRNEAGSDWQQFTVSVSGAGASGCSCAHGGRAGGMALLLVWLLLLPGGRRHRG